MSCGKRRGRKLWENHQALRTIKSSKYERDDNPTIKKHWERVIEEIETPYKDEMFWQTSGDKVHELVGDVIYERLRKIFKLPTEPIENAGLKDSCSSLVSTAEYYNKNTNKRESSATGGTTGGVRKLYSGSGLSMDKEDLTNEVEDGSVSSESTVNTDDTIVSNEHILSSTRSLTKSATRFSRSSKGSSKGGLGKKKFHSSYSDKTKSNSKSSKSIASPPPLRSELAFTVDDLEVQDGDFDWPQRRPHTLNPYYEMLYCNDSVTDMITWKSNYKPKKNEISASEELSEGIELRTQKIAADFFEWWSTFGSKDQKSEFRKPSDIVDLFQLWFDEHASRSLIKDQKLLPCVLKGIAAQYGATERSQENALERHILKDIKAEAVPPQTVAFNASLPNNMKHYPPKNNTEKTWHCVQIPEDLRTMECVWGDIRHLRSTRAFEKWLRHHPHLPLPPVFNTGMNPDIANLHQDSFTISRTIDLGVDLTIPFTQVNIEIKDVLSKLME